MHPKRACTLGNVVVIYPLAYKANLKSKKACRNFFSFSFLLRLNLITMQYFPNATTHHKVLLLLLPAGNSCADSAASSFFFFLSTFLYFHRLIFQRQKNTFLQNLFFSLEKKKLLWIFLNCGHNCSKHNFHCVRLYFIFRKKRNQLWDLWL